MFSNRLWYIFAVKTAVWVSAGLVTAETIHLMAGKGDVEAVMAEIDKGVDVDLPSTKHTTEIGVSPLYIAARFGKSDVVVALIRSGAEVDKFYRSVDSPYPYGTPLHAAVRSGWAEVVDMLLDAGADPNSHDPLVGSPLHLALRNGHPKIAQTLIGEALGGMLLIAHRLLKMSQLLGEPSRATIARNSGLLIS